ncbi:S8 family serine peptidase [Beutenbergia cavernae]|uniref:S8 family serine peptidase n=1 Tax=Beutenbergia cavernae TaxID=84757 RepID=UPI00019AD9BC|nr:S8 family serine peptidase [Beutenbergia cavernae]
MVATLAVGAVPALAEPTPVVPATADEKFTAEALQVLEESETADFWVRFADRADLDAASSVDDWDARGIAVYEALRETAAASQAGTIAALDAADASYVPYWVANAILVKGGTLDLAQSLAASPEVLEIRQTTVYPLEEPVMTPDTTMGPQAVEWGIQAINADDVWATYGTTGEGIVVANIDSGVDYTHPALVSHYRGNNGDGTFTHDYNWLDTSAACDVGPCDTDGHGSHTMGTMIGSDGGANEIGVAPGAEWIAANGCSTCSDADLMEAGQWMLAPRPIGGDDDSGDPTKRPHIINNSWGSRFPSNDPFMEAIITDWEAAGIFGSWSNGNSGPACETSGSPGSRTITYSVGAFAQNGSIASFSARGPGQDGTIKPNIAAPGVAVRSSLPGGAYGNGDGTSMAAPHLAGAIALLWSAAPSLVGDIRGTWALLDETAVDVEDLTCGGTADDNNVWGEGKLDALALLQAAPVGDSGTLAGTVTDEAGAPVAGAAVNVAGPTERDITTDEAGAFSLGVVPGDYTLTATAFGFSPGTATATVVPGETATVTIALTPAATFAVTGTVTNSVTGDPVGGATVSLGAPIADVTTAADGTYAFADVPAGEYTLSVTAGACAEPYAAAVTVDGAETFDVALAAVSDAFGYYCTLGTDGYRQGDTLLDLTGDDVATTVDLPFDVEFYGDRYSQAHVSTNGNLNFLAPVTTGANAVLPRPAAPNAAIYAFWDDLDVDAEAGVYTAATEIDGEQAFVVEYRNVKIWGTAQTGRLSFSITITESGDVTIGFGDVTADDARAGGSSATIGIENADGTIAHVFTHNTAGSVTPGLTVSYGLPDHGHISGVVKDYNDSLPIAGATVTATPDDGGEPVVLETDAEGRYDGLLFFGAYTVTIEADGYRTVTRDVVIDVEEEQITFSPKLRTGIANVDPASFEWILTEGQSRTAELTIGNSGSTPLDFTIGEVPRNVSSEAPAPALSASTLANEQVPAGATSLAEANALVAERAEAADAVDPNARTALGEYTSEQLEAFSAPSFEPDAAGDVLAQWNTGLTVAWGVGYTGDVWVSDPEDITNTQFTPDGVELGSYPADWGGTWPGDMALDSSTGDMCQVNVGGDNGIHCFDPATGAETTVITGGEDWDATSQRGLAYNPTDDVFYIGGWNSDAIFTVAGLSHDTPGAQLNVCVPEDPSVAGLAYNPTSGTLWMVPSSLTTVFYQLVPEDCSTVSTVDYPGDDQGPGAGLELDATGALWAANQLTGDVYLVDVGVPNVSDVPWLSVDPTEGRVPVGGERTLDVTVDTTGLEPGVYGANILVQTNAGRVSTISVPVTLVVSAYQVGVNAGGGEYTDAGEFTWSADQQLTGSATWGWVGQRSEVSTTTRAIGGTTEDTLFQSRRSGVFSYVFEDVPAGTYAIDLGFAEFNRNFPERDRLFDVLVNGDYQIVAHDVAEEVGGLYADQHVLQVEHSGGDLEVQFLNRRSYDFPIVNTVRVTERGDL